MCLFFMQVVLNFSVTEVKYINENTLRIHKFYELPYLPHSHEELKEWSNLDLNRRNIWDSVKPFQLLLCVKHTS